MHALDRSRVKFTSVLEFGLALVSFSGFLRAPAAVALAVRVHALDEILGHARLPLAIIISNVVGSIAAVPIDLARVELAPAAVIGFDLISFSQAITASAVGIAAPAVERRDEARLDSRLALAVVVCVVKPSQNRSGALPRDDGSRRRIEGASKDTASLQLTSKVPSAWTLEILPGYFLLRPLRDGIDQ